MRDNHLLVDAYKIGHHAQNPPGIEYVLANTTARGSRVPDVSHVCALGLQPALQRLLNQQWGEDSLYGFYYGRSRTMVDRWVSRVNRVLGTGSVSADHIREWQKLGYTPLEFRALPEGSMVPLRVPYWTVAPTHKDFGWLGQYWETALQAETWGPTTSATTAYRFRRLCMERAIRTGGDLEFTKWQCHDFSMRGMMGIDAARLSGIGHLVWFLGTDTVPAIEFIEDYYNDRSGFFIGGSVPATEHSVKCLWNGLYGDDEFEFVHANHLMDIYPEGVISDVADTKDFWRYVTEVLPRLKDRILSRNGKWVVRPDSGDPVKILTGDHLALNVSPQRLGLTTALMELFGCTITSKGFAQLDSHIGSIYGDGINYDRLVQIFDGWEELNFASTNGVFGLGSFTYQRQTRDEFGIAMKATMGIVNGQEIPLQKTPKTDDGTKHSARGYVMVAGDGSHALPYTLFDNVTREEFESGANALVPVWCDGEFIGELQGFEGVRERAERWLYAELGL